MQKVQVKTKKLLMKILIVFLLLFSVVGFVGMSPMVEAASSGYFDKPPGFNDGYVNQQLHIYPGSAFWTNPEAVTAEAESKILLKYVTGNNANFVWNNRNSNSLRIYKTKMRVVHNSTIKSTTPIQLPESGATISMSSGTISAQAVNDQISLNVGVTIAGYGFNVSYSSGFNIDINGNFTNESVSFTLDGHRPGAYYRIANKFSYNIYLIEISYNGMTFPSFNLYYPTASFLRLECQNSL